MPIQLSSVGVVNTLNQIPAGNQIPSALGGTATPEEKKGAAANNLAQVIVWAFCLAVGWLLFESAYLLYRASIGGNKPFEGIEGALLPFLKESASTITSIFGSTLGFVLGYYFKNESKNSN